jgi:hypothetical protein
MQSALRSRKILLTIVVGATLCGSLLGYLLSLPPPKGPIVYLTSPPVEFSMGMDKTHYSLADNMSISFSLRNISNETITWDKLGIIGIYPADELGITLTTTYEGVTLPSEGTDPQDEEYSLKTWFHFGGFFLTFDNGTLVEKFEAPRVWPYQLVIEPNGSLNQTLCFSLTYSFHAPNGTKINAHNFGKGTYKIYGVLDPVLNSSEPHETSPITFSIG